VNYTFALVGYEETSEGARYILSVLPRSENKFLYRGKIWVDAKEFAVVRIEAEPAKSPSFWIKRSVIEQTYAKVNNFWLPAYSRTQTEVRLSGHAVLSIEYRDYQIIEADPLPALGHTQPVNRLRAVKIRCVKTSYWAKRAAVRGRTPLPLRIGASRDKRGVGDSRRAEHAPVAFDFGRRAERLRVVVGELKPAFDIGHF
jgi:hypothetical protein